MEPDDVVSVGPTCNSAVQVNVASLPEKDCLNDFFMVNRSYFLCSLEVVSFRILFVMILLNTTFWLCFFWPRAVLNIQIDS